MNILTELKSRFQRVLAEYGDDPAELLDMIRPSQDARFGDYQANCAMPLGKRLGRPPRDIAAEIVDRLDLGHLCEPPEIAGPGFINLTISRSTLETALEQARRDDRLGVPRAEPPRTFVIDYSSPNVAKTMHVGHIRSTVIGDALCRVLRFLGHAVISDNHVGDWGTQFGMIIFGYKHFRDDRAYAEAPVAELERLYKRVNQLIEYHAALAEAPRVEALIAERREQLADVKPAPEPEEAKEAKRAASRARQLRGSLAEAEKQRESLRARLTRVESDDSLLHDARQHPDIGQAVLDETAKLHAGDPENRRLWEEFLPHCRRSIQSVYDRLNISFDHEYGESFYHDQLPGVVDDLLQRGLARESDGAICVFLDGFDAPMIVRKRDGAFLYSTTDLATIDYRMRTWRPDAILYVVDHRQGEHFAKLFAAARLRGYTNVELRHISFGAVLGEDGRPLKTRDGENVALDALMDRAIDAAYVEVCRIDEEPQQFDEAQRREIANIVGLAALKYADLAQNRESDYKFSYEKMVALQGNTATYMQYAYARARSIFTRGEVDIEALRDSNAAIRLEHPAERALGLAIARFSEALVECAADYRPNHVTNYLFELTRQFSAFYEQCHVIKAENPAARDSRALLCDLTGRVIRRGLEVLGISVVERM